MDTKRYIISDAAKMVDVEAREFDTSFFIIVI